MSRWYGFDTRDMYRLYGFDIWEMSRWYSYIRMVWFKYSGDVKMVWLCYSGSMEILVIVWFCPSRRWFSLVFALGRREITRHLPSQDNASRVRPYASRGKNPSGDVSNLDLVIYGWVGTDTVTLFKYCFCERLGCRWNACHLTPCLIVSRLTQTEVQSLE